MSDKASQLTWAAAFFAVVMTATGIAAALMAYGFGGGPLAIGALLIPTSFGLVVYRAAEWAVER